MYCVLLYADETWSLAMNTAEGIREKSTEEDIWAQEGRCNKGMEKTANGKAL